jgi:hypothetical protein
LEDNVLHFPPEDDDILIHVGDRDEQLLHARAWKIRSALKDDARAIVDSGASPEQQNEAAKQLLNRLTDEEKALLEQSFKFMTYRIMRLVYNWFAVTYPKGQDDRAMLRVLWFFSEMRKFNNSCLMEDFEWNNNRNEDDPAFDDFAWWAAVDAKIRAIYPDGVFTEKSFEKTQRLHDEYITQKIIDYYKEHPEEREALSQRVNQENGGETAE